MIYRLHQSPKRIEVGQWKNSFTGGDRPCRFSWNGDLHRGCAQGAAQNVSALRRHSRGGLGSVVVEGALNDKRSEQQDKKLDGRRLHEALPVTKTGSSSDRALSAAFSRIHIRGQHSGWAEEDLDEMVEWLGIGVKL